MATVDGGSGGSSKKKKAKAPIIGPVQPKSARPSPVSKPAVIGPVQPKASKPSPSVSSTNALQAKVTPPPRYLTPSPKTSKSRVVDTEAFKSYPKSDAESILDRVYGEKRNKFNAEIDPEFLRSLSPEVQSQVIGAKPEKPVKDEGFANLDDITNPDVFIDNPDKAKGKEASDMSDFLKKIRPANFDPAYGGPALPEKAMHRGGDKDNALKWYWDEDFIKNALKKNEPGTSYYESDMNDFISFQLGSRSKIAKNRTTGRAYAVSEILKKAEQKAYDGDFDYLEKQLEKNPDLLEFNKYREDYAMTPEKINRQFAAIRKNIKDPWLDLAMSKRKDMMMQHYERVRDYYVTANKVVNRAIEKYEAKYNESVEHHDQEDKAGPAIPDMEADERKTQELLDEVGNNAEQRGDLGALLLGEKGRKAVSVRHRTAIKERLGVKDLPTVKEMLAVQVSNGDLDPEDEQAVEDAIRRFKNPSHPDTRAMYFGFAQTINKKLDPEKDGLPFINGPIKKSINLQNKQAKAEAEYDAKINSYEYDTTHHDSASDTAMDFLKIAGHTIDKNFAFTADAMSVANNPEKHMGRDEDGEVTFKVDDPNGLGAVGWTFDKLMRLNYTVAGATDAWNSIDKDPGNGTSWTTGMVGLLGGPLQAPMLFGLQQGESLASPLDEVWDNPKNLGKPFKAGYEQFFRGSGFKGTEEDTTPIFFAHVIANNGLRDPEDNIYDKSWYHHTSGLMLDLGTDPLNLVGVGLVDDAVKIPKSWIRAAKSIDDADDVTVDSIKLLDDIADNASRGPAAQKAHDVQQMLLRVGDEHAHGVPMVADTKLVPFRFTVEKVDGTNYQRCASQMPHLTPLEPFKPVGAEARSEINRQLTTLNTLKTELSNNTALQHYEMELNKVADELAFAPISVPEVSVGRLMKQTAIRIPTQGAEGNFDNLGGQFWQRILKPLIDGQNGTGDLIRNWAGHKSETKFATMQDAATGETRLTSRAATAKAAMERQEKNLDAADYYGTDPSVNANFDEKLTQQIDQGYDIDEVTGKPSVWEEYDVDSFIEAGAPGLLDGSFSPSAKFAAAAGIPEEEFAKFFSEQDILEALWYGSKMLEESDETVARSLMIARQRIKDSKAKLKVEKDPKVRAATYKALAMGYSDVSQHTLSGAFRYLDTLNNARVTGRVTAVGAKQSEIKFLDEVIESAEKALDESFAQADDMGDYIGGFEGALPARNGTYEGFDFKGKDFNSIVDEQGVENFTSKSAHYQAIIDEATKQRTELIRELKKADTGKITTLDPAEAYEVERMLPENSQFRKADGTIDVGKVDAALTRNIDNPSESLKVGYKLPQPTKPAHLTMEQFKKTATWAKYRQETVFLDNLSRFVESRANTLFRSEKTDILRKKWAKEGKVEEEFSSLDTFWTKRDGVKMGPAEAKLGPRPTTLSDSLPNYTARKLRDPKDKKKSGAADYVTANKDATDDIWIDTSKAAETFAPTPGTTKGQKHAKALLLHKQKAHDKAVLRAREMDAARYAELKALEERTPSEGFKLNYAENKLAYRRSYDKAVDEALVELNRGRILQTSANARLPVGDRVKAFEKKMSDELKYESLQLQIRKQKAIAAKDAEALKAIEVQRKALIKKRADMYTKIKKVRYEANMTKKIMVTRIVEDQVLQVANMPAKVTQKQLTLRIAGMQKNLQFTGALFDGAERAAKLVPEKIRHSMATYAVRPSRQLKQRESIIIRARHESKTPVVVRGNLEVLNDIMRNIPEKERVAMFTNYRRDLPYEGPLKDEYQKLSEYFDDVMKIINGHHDHYMYLPPGATEAVPLSLNEITQFLPEGFNFDPTVLQRAYLNRIDKARRQKVKGSTKTEYGRVAVGTDSEWDEVFEQFRNNDWALAADGKMPTLNQIHAIRNYGGDPEIVAGAMSKDEASKYIDHLKSNNGKSADGDTPFSSMPEAQSEFIMDDLIRAMGMKGSQAKDVTDPFRLGWVFSLAADQAHQLRQMKHVTGETFGVRLPKDPAKLNIVNKLRKEGWDGVGDVPGYLFPPEIIKEVETLMGFAKPGPQSAKMAQMFDNALGIWKQGMTIYNPAYYTRNGIGEMMVSWLDGVNDPRWYKRAYRVQRYLKRTDTDLMDLINKFDALKGSVPVDVAKHNEVLFSLKGGQKVTIEDVLGWYIDMGLKSTFVNTDLGKGVRGLANQALDSGKIRKGVAGVNNKIHEGGEGFEDWLRMAHFMHAMERSGKGSLKEAAEFAAGRVRRSHFDYTDFSTFEKTVMLRAFPFYKWIRRGAPLMMQHLFMTPGKMAALPKVLNTNSNMGFDPINLRNDDPVLSTNDILDDQNGHLPNYSGIAPGWVRDLFAYAMQPAEDDEYANFMRITTPQIDGLSGLMNFKQNYQEKGLVGGLADTTAYPLLNPAIKSGIELAQNKGMDPDFPHEIYGGDYNESLGINDGEAIGAYLARQATPHTNFLAKLSRRGKLPDGLNISDKEHDSDAFRDMLSFFSGVGFYQGRQEDMPIAKEPTNEDSASATAGSNDAAVGQYKVGDIPMFTGAPAGLNKPTEDNNPLISVLGGLAKGGDKTTSGKKVSGKYKKGKGWVDYPKRGRSGGYGGSGYSSGGSGSSGSSGSYDLLALLRKLKESIDQGDVVDPDKFIQEQ